MRNYMDIFRGENWNPTREISQLQRNIDRMFEDMLSPIGEREGAGALSRFTPAVDVEETDSHFVLSMDLPGVKKGDINVEVVDNQLLVSGERKEEREEKKKNRYLVERSYGTFRRAFTLPTSVDSSKVEAQFEDGVLKIAIPKSEQAKPRQIRIGESKEGGFFSKLLNVAKGEEREAAPTKSEKTKNVHVA